MGHRGKKLILEAVSCIGLRACRLCACQENPAFFLSLFAVCDVADIALNNWVPVFIIDVADKLHFSQRSVSSLKRQIVVAKIAIQLQLLKRSLACVLIAEQTDFPKFLSQKFVP